MRIIDNSIIKRESKYWKQVMFSRTNNHNHSYISISESRSEYDFSVCPYTSSHKFDAMKYFHHISRCKDGQKVKHLYGHCKYNNLHIFKLGDLTEHEHECPDATISQLKADRLMQCYQKEMADRQMQQIYNSNKTLEDCTEPDGCLCKLQVMESRLQYIPKDVRDKLLQLLRKYQNLWHKQDKLRKKRT